MKKLIQIDEVLYQAIKMNAQRIGNTTTKEIQEMLWLALKPRNEQLKKILATRTRTTLHIKDKPNEEETQEDDFESVLDSL